MESAVRNIDLVLRPWVKLKRSVISSIYYVCSVNCEARSHSYLDLSAHPKKQIKFQNRRFNCFIFGFLALVLAKIRNWKLVLIGFFCFLALVLAKIRNWNWFFGFFFALFVFLFWFFLVYLVFWRMILGLKLRIARQSYTQRQSAHVTSSSFAFAEYWS